MGGRISMVVLFVFLVANLLQLQSTYGKTFSVGDSNGWQIPRGNTHFYDDWADHRIFNVGDVLVFNFTTGEHNVAEVSESDFESCSAANPISNMSTGPATITLNRSGEHYFICGLPDHCSKGQKMEVEVKSGSGSGFGSGSGTDIAPTPSGSPSGTPTGTSYTVGDSTGWVVPTGHHEFYDDWADNKHFAVGDTLVFNFTTGQHNVMEVSEADYDACNTTNAISTVSDGPAKITFKRTGDHYFICGISGHCAAGQKMKVEVEYHNGQQTGPAPTVHVATVSLVFFVSFGLALLW
ncbi:hypothetical protein V6N13_066488 [Hibiscus sabdariffa]|uniref:Phytocyanin domain-containing protein n=1 Tax=Hibiscus sabdariffa TaxID=183260 RepID=A0ABR2DQV1_9ROSI